MCLPNEHKHMSQKFWVDSWCSHCLADFFTAFSLSFPYLSVLNRMRISHLITNLIRITKLTLHPLLVCKRLLKLHRRCNLVGTKPVCIISIIISVMNLFFPTVVSTERPWQHLYCRCLGTKKPQPLLGVSVWFSRKGMRARSFPFPPQIVGWFWEVSS